MARGKHANKAANREQAVLQREAPLRNEITRLQTALKKAQDLVVDLRAAHAEETRKARALIEANTSERVADLERQIETLASERDAAQASFLSINKNWQSVSGRIMDRLHAEFDDHHEAVQAFLEMCGQDPDAPLYVSDDEEITARRFGAEGVQALRAARRRQRRAGYPS